MRFFTLGYVRRDGRTLMLHRNRKPNDVHEGKWNGLGGKLEEWETPWECIVREVSEESGLIARDPELKAFITLPNFANGETWHMWIFVLRDFTGELAADCPEWELAWIPDAEVLGLNLWPSDRIFLPSLDEPGMFAGKFQYRDGELESYEYVRM